MARAKVIYLVANMLVSALMKGSVTYLQYYEETAEPNFSKKF